MDEIITVSTYVTIILGNRCIHCVFPSHYVGWKDQTVLLKYLSSKGTELPYFMRKARSSRNLLKGTSPVFVLMGHSSLCLLLLLSLSCSKCCR